nr:ATP-binding protein [Treponema sp.]
GSGSVKILLYGLSGTGKTEFSRYLGQCLGKDLLLKRASDIFDKYVGGTEHNIASAFQEAAANDKILLFDEADSFFSDRNNAVRNFERTQVNEFLTQLEEFPGIVICTTNLKQVMDPAMLRRFHITVDFKALTQEGIAKLLSKFFKTYTFSEKMIKEVASYNSVTPGDFSRLADTIKFMDEEDISSQGIIDELCNIQKEKDQVGGGQHKKTVGFCA